MRQSQFAVDANPLLVALLAAVVATGCANPSAGTATDESAGSTASSADDVETHSEWTGGGTVTIDGTDVELPADPAWALAIHPRKAASLVESMTALAGDVDDTSVMPEGWTSDFIRASWPRLLPKIMVRFVRSPFRREGLVENIRERGVTDVLGRELTHLDPDRRLVAVMGLGRQRDGIRHERLRLQPEIGPDGYANPIVAFRLLVPATDTEALAEQLRTACRRAESNETTSSTPSGSNGSGERWAPSLCGYVRRVEPRDDWVVADIWYNRASHNLENGPSDVSLASSRDRRWRPTPALRAFATQNRAVSVYTTSRATMSLGHWKRSSPSTVEQSNAFEFEDVAVFADGDGEGGFNLDLVQTYTERGRRVDRAGRVDQPLPEFEVPGEMLSGTRGWNIRQAAEQTTPPRWLSPSPFQSDGVPYAMLLSDWRLLLGADFPWLFHMLTAYPTMTIHQSWERTSAANRVDTLSGWYGIQPGAARFAVGRRSGGSATDERQPVAAGHVRMMETFADYVDHDHEEVYERWIGRFGPQIRRSRPDAADQVHVDLAVGADLDTLRAGTAPAEHGLSLEADLEAMAERISLTPSEEVYPKLEDARRQMERYREKADEAEGARASHYEKQVEKLERRIANARSTITRFRKSVRRGLRSLSSASLVSSVGRHTRRTHLHVGPGRSSPVESPSAPFTPTSFEAPPHCYTDLIRFTSLARTPRHVHELFEKTADERPRDRTPEAYEPFLEDADERIETMAAECDDLTRPRQSDLHLVRSQFLRRWARVDLKQWEHDRAADRYQRSCELGEADSCRLEHLLRELDLARVDHVRARNNVEATHLYASPAGIADGEGKLFTWPELFEVPLEVNDERELYRNVPELPRLINQFIAVEGYQSSKEHFRILALDADRGLPVGHVDRIYRHAIREPYTIGLGIAVRSDRGETTKRGWQVVQGRRIDTPGATVRIAPAGVTVEVGGRALPPVEDCPSDGPTVCAARATGKVDAALARQHERYTGDTDDSDGGDEHVDRLLADYRLDVVGRLLKDAAERAGGPRPNHLQIVADARVPQAVVTHVISAAVAAPDADGNHSRAANRLFDKFYLRPTVRSPTPD